MSDSCIASAVNEVSRLEVPLDRDVFLRTLLREVAGTLEDVVGVKDASGFVSVVGQRMGDHIDRAYRRALAVSDLTREQVAAVLVDLKRRIEGDFYIVEEDDDKIVLGNRACPFGDKVIGRTSMCMMTSNVFGVIAAENLGYAKVELQKTIARGDPGCRIVVYLRPTPAAQAVEGREYHRGGRCDGGRFPRAGRSGPGGVAPRVGQWCGRGRECRGERSRLRPARRAGRAQAL